MEAFTAVFTQLGVDSSLVPQFFIAVIVFTLAHFLFLGKLQEVLENREEKTVKLENSADETLEKVSLMQTEYKSKIEAANRSALKTLSDKKSSINLQYSSQYKQTEKEIGQFVDQSRTEFSNEVAGNKDKYLADADALAKSLVEKILQ